MALHIPRAPGLHSMLKEGAKHFSGLDEAIYRNIDACKEMSKTTRTAFGPTGMNKMVINHIEKLFVTNDAATILNELEVQHPAAKMIVLACKQQDEEVGDGTNFVMIFAGALLDQAEELLRLGLSPTEVIEGYEEAVKKCLVNLESLTQYMSKAPVDMKNVDQVAAALKTAVASKQYGSEDFLAKLIAQACTSIYSEKHGFNVDSVRVCQVLGAGLLSSTVLPGMVFNRRVETEVKHAEAAKVLIYSCPLDNLDTETKGTVLIKTAQELKDFSKGEEHQIEAHVKDIVDSGAKVVVSGGKVGDMFQHFCNKHNLLLLRITSKWELRRLCKVVNATALPTLTKPTAEELGFVDRVFTQEIGDNTVVIFQQDKTESKISTIILRGATKNLLDDVERAIEDGINTYKALTRDTRTLPGAGVTELILADQLRSFAATRQDRSQYPIGKFADALEVVPKALSENCGLKATEVLAKMYASLPAMSSGDCSTMMGVDVESPVPEIRDVIGAGIIDLYLVKYWGLKFATKAACTVLQVDQIIMAKQAGGVKPRDPQAGDAGDD